MSNVVSYNAKKITSGNVSKTNINFSSTINDYTTSTSFEMEQVNSPSELDLNMFTNTNDSSNVFFDGLKSISDAILSTGASVANTAVAITQGVGEFGEALVDGVATIGTAGASIGTGVYDGIKYVYSKITGADFSSTTKAMWNNEKEFVAKEHVKDAYTNFHENNIIGKTLDEHSFSLFKSTGAAYQVANRVGYIGGVVALSAVTAGAGSALTGTSLASTSVASLSAGSATVNISANSLLSGGITAVAGLGKNSSKAWNDGASTTEGLAYGIATGAWEGLEMAFGSAINSLKLGIGSGIQEQLVNTGAHVALDSIDGATSAFIEPLLQTMITLDNPAKLPDVQKIDRIEEPYVLATIMTPQTYIGPLMELCQQKRGIYVDLKYIDDNRMNLIYKLPLAEIVYNFFDRLKSCSRGFASFDYVLDEYLPSKLVKMDILLNNNIVDALSCIVHRDFAYNRGKIICQKLRKIIPRQQFEVPIQAAINGKVIARETIAALRKDVLAKCYGGDITRKKKLLEKQKEGKKRMKKIGNVDIPQEAFMTVLSVDDD